MSENVEAVKRAFEAFNHRDIDGILAVCDPEVDWTPPADWLGSRTYHGHDGVREAIADMVGVFEDLRAEPVRLIE
jgi:ketosteroid isomerase-like protein